VLLLLAASMAIIILLLARILTRRSSVGDETSHTGEASEIESVAPPPSHEETETEIHPILEGESLTEFRPPREDVEVMADIRPLLNREESEGCPYCALFKDLGTAVCPNCGRPLNIRLIQQDE
jgi:hypothetical protein